MEDPLEEINSVLKSSKPSPNLKPKKTIEKKKSSKELSLREKRLLREEKERQKAQALLNPQKSRPPPRKHSYSQHVDYSMRMELGGSKFRTDL